LHVVLFKPNQSMRFNTIAVCFLLLFIKAINLGAQQSAVDTVFLEMNQENLPYFKHTLQKGETLYQLSKKYGADIDKVHQWNSHLLINQISLGTEIKIPFEKDKVLPKGSTVVLYTVMPKENLFSIVRRNLGMDLAFIKSLNQMEEDALQISQKLILGYFEKSPHPLAEEIGNLDAKTALQKSDSLLTIAQHKLFRDFQKQLETATIGEERGIAFWKKESGIDKGNYVLHREAPLNSVIEITNPMFNKTVYAKVVGKIPPNTYTYEVKVVITPGLAKELGAIDSRFFTYIKYQMP